MGFFSWDCKGCGHPMLSDHATNGINYWMNDVVVINHDDSIQKGSYDGYGRVDGVQLKWGEWNDSTGRFDNEPCCWHRACWDTNDQPSHYDTPSDMSEDQGWFFDEGDHDMEKPEAKITAEEWLREKVGSLSDEDLSRWYAEYCDPDAITTVDEDPEKVAKELTEKDCFGVPVNMNREEAIKAYSMAVVAYQKILA